MFVIPNQDVFAYPGFLLISQISKSAGNYVSKDAGNLIKSARYLNNF